MKLDKLYFIQEEHYLQHDVAVILGQFPAITAKVLSYRLFHDIPYYEIASILGITESSAKVIYHRGRIKLKHILESGYGYVI